MGLGHRSPTFFYICLRLFMEFLSEFFEFCGNLFDTLGKNQRRISEVHGTLQMFQGNPVEGK